MLENAAEKPGTHPRTVAKTAESVLSGIGNVIQAAFYVEEPAVQEPTIVDQTQSEGNEANQKSEIGTTEEPTVRTDEDNDDIEQKKERVNNLVWLIFLTVSVHSNSKDDIFYRRTFRTLRAIQYK